jgi:hypothetical protein
MVERVLEVEGLKEDVDRLVMDAEEDLKTGGVRVSGEGSGVLVDKGWEGRLDGYVERLGEWLEGREDGGTELDEADKEEGVEE